MAKVKEDQEPKFVVVSEFRDINDYAIMYEAGADVSHLDANRLEVLMEQKLIEKK